MQWFIMAHTTNESGLMAPGKAMHNQGAAAVVSVETLLF